MLRRVIAGRYAEIANTRRVGGQSEVFQAADLDQGGRHVAVKIVPAKSDEIFRIYFERETVALRTLSHPNIASLLDSGVDEAAGVYYVVLDWIPETLTTWLAGLSEPPGWDDLADAVALPLAAALAHSHSLSVLHRDVKPGNVLWDGSKPLLADFALSKIKNQIAGATDATVLGPTSAPWAPPDRSSRGSARFDVYGLAATLLQCVSKHQFSDYHHVAAARANADTPPKIADLLRRSLDPDPMRRPADGQVFYHELQAIQTERRKKWHRARQVPIALTRTARESLEQTYEGRMAEDVIDQRLGTATYAVPRLKTEPDGRTSLTADEFQLVGDQVKLVLAFEGDTKLVCIRAEVADFEDLEFLRKLNEAVMIDSRDLVFTARRPIRPHESAQAAFDLRNRLRKSVQDAGDRSSERITNARLDTWSKLIDAKEQLEQRLEEPITYTRVGSSGVEFTLRANTALTASFLDQDRIVRPLGDEPAGRGVRVVVVDVDDDGTDFTVRATDRGADIPFDGVLVRDRTPSRAAIRRQKNALASLREGSAARPHLRELVLDPAQAQTPEPVEFQPRTGDLDEDKKVAVSKALGSSDLFLVEGPPGTGKTSFICELVNQYLAERPRDKVLLVSQMHVAIDNAITRLYKSGINSVVRLSSNDDRVDAEASHLLLGNKLAVWVAGVVERAAKGMAELAEHEGVQIEHLTLALCAEEALATLRRQQGQAEVLGPLTAEDRLDNEDLPEHRAEMLAGYQRATERAEEAVAAVRTAAGEASVDVPAELDQSALQQLVEGVLGGGAVERRLHQLIQTQGDWLASLNDPAAAEPMFLPTQSVVAGTCMGFLANSTIGEMQFDLCIIDEASRATAAELLVPMTRSKRWVMVGDPKQLPPMMEDVLKHPDLIKTFDLEPAVVSTSLFDTLLDEAPQACCTSLVTQHRMAAPIGELISQTFYGGALIHDPAPAVDPDSIDEAERLVWFSSSHRANRHEEAKFPGSASASNKLEVEMVAEMVTRLDNEAGRGRYRRLDGHKLEVLVLTGYQKQRTEIQRALRRLGAFDSAHIDVQVKTIDAVQGRESDVVIFSVTRSNLISEFGFLGQPYAGRMNVALSRAREALWIVGDSDFCASREGPLKDVLHHIMSSSEGTVQYL
ncbi:AAA domain-containing protein [Mycobacterium kansasii]|uniref:AAA domain-containing protein n=1 Tax=Mycobacterium kansasii TaxID=1768 RepID=UPI001CE30734|nr:AAA domain-containing protein [Mycobacterium kansasii]UCA22903.1 protein kinase [Mycobacterium kansasii]